jgi:hypothetical protein
MKKIFWGIFLVLLMAFSSFGCFQRAPFEATQEIWDDKRNATNISYQDKIVSFYINKNGDEIVFLGERFHYIFTYNTEEFSELLKAKEFLHLTKKNFNISSEIDKDDKRKIISTIRTILYDTDFTVAQRRWLKEHGFSLISTTNNPIVVAASSDSYAPPQREMISMNIHQHIYSIEGTRYVANKQVNTRGSKLREAIELTIVEYNYNEGNKLHQIAMTPIALAEDVAMDILVIGGNLILSPLYLLMVITD